MTIAIWESSSMFFWSCWDIACSSENTNWFIFFFHFVVWVTVVSKADFSSGLQNMTGYTSSLINKILLPVVFWDVLIYKTLYSFESVYFSHHVDCNILIAWSGLCEFAYIFYVLFVWGLSVEGCKIFNDSSVECHWCGWKCRFDVGYVGRRSISGGWLSWSRKWSMCAYTCIHRSQKIWIAQKIACKLYTCNLWRHIIAVN